MKDDKGPQPDAGLDHSRRVVCARDEAYSRPRPDRNEFSGGFEFPVCGLAGAEEINFAGGYLRRRFRARA